MKLHYLLIPLFCLLLSGKGAAEDGDRLLMFWNLENYFDWRDDSLSVSPSDYEFSSFGPRRWTRKRFFEKTSLIAKSILYIGSDEGRLPDVIGVAEVENRFVLKQLTEETLLRKLDYRIVHFDSPDPRGIDCALLYRASVFDFVEATPIRVGSGGESGGDWNGGGSFQTRDILHVHLKDRLSGKDWDLLVCHFPSKYGGAAASSPRRLAAARRLEATADSLRGERVNTDDRETRGRGVLVAMGDFNDVPTSSEIASIRSLFCLGTQLSSRGEGSIRFQGHWQLIDLYFVPEEARPFCTMSIARLPFLLEHDRAHGGEKPLRTYSGPRFRGGVSDHCPVLLRVSAALGSARNFGESGGEH